MSVSIQFFATSNQSHVCPNCGEEHLVTRGKHFVDTDLGEVICSECVSVELSDIAYRLFGGDAHAR